MEEREMLIGSCCIRTDRSHSGLVSICHVIGSKRAGKFSGAKTLV